MLSGRYQPICLGLSVPKVINSGGKQELFYVLILPVWEIPLLLNAWWQNTMLIEV